MAIHIEAYVLLNERITAQHNQNIVFSFPRVQESSMQQWADFFVIFDTLRVSVMSSFIQYYVSSYMILHIHILFGLPFVSFPPPTYSAYYRRYPLVLPEHMHFYSWDVLVGPSLDTVVFHIIILTTLTNVFFTASLHVNFSDAQLSMSINITTLGNTNQQYTCLHGNL